MSNLYCSALIKHVHSYIKGNGNLIWLMSLLLLKHMLSFLWLNLVVEPVTAVAYSVISMASLKGSNRTNTTLLIHNYSGRI